MNNRSINKALMIGTTVVSTVAGSVLSNSTNSTVAAADSDISLDAAAGAVYVTFGIVLVAWAIVWGVYCHRKCKQSADTPSVTSRAIFKSANVEPVVNDIESQQPVLRI